MVRPSRERLNHLARELAEVLTRSRSVIFLKQRDVVLQAITQALTDELRREEEREENARRRIAGMRGAPRPNTREWDELFSKLVEEEHLRDGLDS